VHPRRRVRARKKERGMKGIALAAMGPPGCGSLPTEILGYLFVRRLVMPE